MTGPLRTKRNLAEQHVTHKTEEKTILYDVLTTLNMFLVAKIRIAI